MRESLFVEKQSVLLLGEGNFSFSVQLSQLNLKLKITSCCYEKEPKYPSTKENINFLKRKGVRVLLGIDATHLHESEALNKHTFHRIVFNFPHVGGKTKIQLNRELLLKFFTSCASLLSKEGAVIVSLCRGQGGTIYEVTPRPYEDTWKIVEMAAHGGFILTIVEPWDENSILGRYSCVGRRSNASPFHREGALVHVFQSAQLKLDLLPFQKYLDVLEPQEIKLPEGVVKCSHLESILLKKYLLLNNTSIIHKILESLVNFCSEKSYKAEMHTLSPILNDNTLRNFSNIDSLITQLNLKENINNSLLCLYWGVAFQTLESNFNSCPLFCYVVLNGHEASLVCQEWIGDLKNSDEVSSDMIHKRGSHTCAVILDDIAIKIFHLSGWREFWASGAKIVSNDERTLVWQSASISPPTFIFDLSLKSQLPLENNAICKVIWQMAGEFVECVEEIDNYSSPDGWFSKCFRLTFRSYEMALYRSLVVRFLQVIGQVLERHLDVTMR